VTQVKEREPKPWEDIALLKSESKNSTLFVFISAVAGKIFKPIHELIVGYELKLDNELTFAKIDPILQTAMLEALVFINECCQRCGYQEIKSEVELVNNPRHVLYFYYILLTAGYFEMNSFNDIRRPLSLRRETMGRIRMINTKQKVLELISLLARRGRGSSGRFQSEYRY